MVIGDRLCPPWRVLATWTLLYLAASILFCSPFLSLDTFATSLDKGDVRLIAWTLAWHARWPLTGAWPLDAPFFAPELSALAYTDPMIGLGLAAAPVTALVGPIVSFNLLRVLIPVTSALAMAWLVWHYLRDATAAFVSGFALAFAYSQIATVYIGLIHLAVLAGFMVTALFLDRWWRHQRTVDLAAAFAVACWQALVSWYAAVIAIVVIATQLIWLALFERQPLSALLQRGILLAGCAILVLVLMWPLAHPFLGAPGPEREELVRFSLEAQNFFQPPTDTWIGRWINGGTGSSWDYRRSYFVGTAAGILALIGMLATIARRDEARRVLWAVPLAVLGFVLSLGPSPGGTWRPYDLLMAIPGVSSFRVPGRLSVLVAIGIAMLAGIAVHRVPKRVQRLATILLVSVFVGEGYMAHLARPKAQVVKVPTIFQELQRERPTRLLVLPMLARTSRWPDEADYPLFALPTWTPVANGYGRRTPSIYDALVEAVPEFPRGPLGDALRFYGISHVVVLANYTDDGGAALSRAADTSPDLEPVSRVDDDVLYRVRSSAKPLR